MHPSKLPLLLCLLSLLALTSCTVKSIYSSCMCDISSNCDSQCCCDPQCSAALVSTWNTYQQCASDGFNIPFCTNFNNQPLHTHDLYQGLRVIYTIIQRLFCISKVNFIDATSSYVSTTSNSQLPSASTISALNPNIQTLTPLPFPSLPRRNNLGVCQQTAALRDMNNIPSERCNVYVSSSSTISSNNLLSVSSFLSANSFNSSMKIFLMETASANSLVPLSSGSVSTTCSTINTTISQCYVIKHIKLVFTKSTTTTIDYTSSYIVVGQTYIKDNIHLKLTYSYTFKDSTGNLPYSSYLGYTQQAPLVLLYQNTTSSTYYKIFNPVNLAFRNLDGSCRTLTSDPADQTGQMYLYFGVNTILSCVGSSSMLLASIQNSFNYIGSIGSASSSLGDYVPLAIDSNLNNNTNLQLLFHYIKIGTQNYPQYQIIKAKLVGLSASPIGQPTLFVQYQQAPTSTFLNVPTPPVVDSYLPDDFLYPFYVV